MHTATVEALSVRKDGTGFKANLPGKGEQWLSLPQNMTGRVEWKKTYTIGWTESPGAKGTFYNVKELNADSFPGDPKVVNVNGETFIRPNSKPNGNDPRQIFVCAIVKEWVKEIPVAETTTLISAIQSAMEAYDQTFGAQ